MRAVARAARRKVGGDFVAFSPGGGDMVELVSARHAGCLRQARNLIHGRSRTGRPPRWWAVASWSIWFVRRH